MSVETFDIELIEYNANWKHSTFDSIDYPEGQHTLEIHSPVTISAILEQGAPAIDVAHCINVVDRNGWETYLNQHMEYSSFTAELLPGLTPSASSTSLYAREHHRLTPIKDDNSAFMGILCLSGMDIKITDHLQFSKTKGGITARLTRTRTDKGLVRVINFECAMS